ncbi:hypothetical protein D1007_36929 [Hordeum vulgare]|nr:hypothetical protein D1007_36929 [Hordeum vulgare]
MLAPANHHSHPLAAVRHHRLIAPLSPCFFLPLHLATRIVDGETVPAEIVKGYKRYCRIAESSSTTTTVCHLCIFELELHPNGIVHTADMILHCMRHPTIAVRCGRFGCAAKVPPGRDIRQHTYFCHDLPADWWRLP